MHEAAPHAVYVPRKGEVSAWDNALFVKTVRATGKKTLIIAGVWTSVCVMFPALTAKAEGYKVYAVIDASGDPSEMASRTTIARFIQAGIVPISTNAVICEFHRTWNRPDATQLADLYCMASPNYRAVIESFQRAEEVAKKTTTKATGSAKCSWLEEVKKVDRFYGRPNSNGLKRGPRKTRPRTQSRNTHETNR